MSENYQNSITDQICKVQTSKKLIALYDRLRYTSYNSYAQLHAKGEFEENGHKVHSLIGISIQDYSSVTGDKKSSDTMGTKNMVPVIKILSPVFIWHPNKFNFCCPELPLAFLNLNGHKVKYLVCRMAMAILLHNSFLFPATYITTSRKY